MRSDHGHVGVLDIAAMYGVTKQAVQQWAAQPGFPQPIYRKPKQLVWHLEDVLAWAKRNGRDVAGDV